MKNEIKPIIVILIAVWLIVFGIGILQYAGLFNIKSFNELYQLFYDKGFILILALFFIISSIYMLIKYLKKSNNKNKKINYWINLYTPVYNFTDLMLLPILYIVAIPTWIAIIMAPSGTKYIGIIATAIPTFLIIYDLIYKIKNKNEKR